MYELIISHKLDINSNMDILAENIKKDIDTKYNLVVTDDSLPETKKLMATINKEKADFKDKYKSFKNTILEPLVQLDEKVKQIETYYNDARTALENQVKKFEAGKLARAKEVCIEYAMAQCEEKNIDFNAVTISDLFTKLGSTTTAGNISGVAKSEIDNRIQAIENQILKERLAQEEKLKHEREIAEAARKQAEEDAKVREQQLLAKAEREKQEAVAKAKEEIIKAGNDIFETGMNIRPFQEKTPFDEPVVKENLITEQPKPVVTDDGKRVYKITFEFEVTSSVNAPKDKLIEKVKQMFLTEAGNKNLKNTKGE